MFEERLKIIGTSHISSESVQEIKQEFLRFQPDQICVELDTQRLYALLHPNEKPNNIALLQQLGIGGFVFAYIARKAQKKLGKIVGMQPGSDMLFAVELAKNNKLTLQLIDRHIQKTIKRLIKKITLKEKWRFVKDIFTALFLKKSQPKVKIDLDKVPSNELIDVLLVQLQERYPSLHKVLVDERNHYMAKQLVVLLKKFPEKKFMAVVGAGHKKEMEKLLEFYNKKIDIL